MSDFRIPPGLPIVMSLERVVDALSMSESTVQRLVRQGEFPRPRELSSRRVGWLTTEVVEWAMQRPCSDMLPPPNTGASKPKRK